MPPKVPYLKLRPCLDCGQARGPRAAHPRPSAFTADLNRLRCCNATCAHGESARCSVTSSPSKRRPSRISTTSSCPLRPSLATRSRRRSEGASSRVRSRCQPEANTPAGSSAVSPELDSCLPNSKRGGDGSSCNAPTAAHPCCGKSWSGPSSRPVGTRPRSADPSLDPYGGGGR